MVRSNSTRFVSFLDRFESRLEVGCELLKRQLLAQVDQQFGVVREKVTQLRGRFGGGRANRNALPSVHIDDPQVETVSLDEWMQKGREEAAAESLNLQSTSSGVKRKSAAKRTQSTNKRHKSSASSAGRNKFMCKYRGCGKSFLDDSHLIKHERIHLGVKPFSCSWDNCSYSAEQRNSVVTHIRMTHFKLPRSIKEQNRLNITDDRNPNDFVQVDNQLLARRLK